MSNMTDPVTHLDRVCALEYARAKYDALRRACSYKVIISPDVFQEVVYHISIDNRLGAIEVLTSTYGHVVGLSLDAANDIVEYIAAKISNETCDDFPKLVSVFAGNELWVIIHIEEVAVFHVSGELL